MRAVSCSFRTVSHLYLWTQRDRPDRPYAIGEHPAKTLDDHPAKTLTNATQVAAQQ